MTDKGKGGKYIINKNKLLQINHIDNRYKAEMFVLLPDNSTFKEVLKSEERDKAIMEISYLVCDSGGNIYRSKNQRYDLSSENESDKNGTIMWRYFKDI